MNRVDIMGVISIAPLLTQYGFYPGPSILDDEEICTAVCEFLEPAVRIKTINRNAHSYMLKHLAEAKIGRYVANGQFICAAIHLDFRWKYIDDSPNAVFGISQRWLRAEWNAHHG